MAESFNATIKKELIHLHSWPNLAKLRADVFQYIEIYYNRKRPHTKINNISPCEMEKESLKKLDKGMPLAA